MTTEENEKPSETLLENFFNKRDREVIESLEKRNKPVTMHKIAQLKMHPQRSRKQSIETVNLDESSLEMRHSSTKQANGTPDDI